MVGGPEIWGLLFGEWRPTRTHSGDARATSDMEIDSYDAFEASRDDGNVQFGISGGQDMFEQLPSLVVWI